MAGVAKEQTLVITSMTDRSGSKAGGFGSPDICDFIKSDQPAMFPPVGIRLAMPA